MDGIYRLRWKNAIATLPIYDVYIIYKYVCAGVPRYIPVP